VHFITTFSNIGNEAMTIKVYHAFTDQVYEAETSYTFKVQSITGSTNNPFQIYAFSDDDAPFSIGSIPGQMTVSGMPFESIQLDDYLIRMDMDSIVWTSTSNPNLSVSFNGMELNVQSINGFIGQTQLTITGTEQTPQQHSASTTVPFLVTAPYLGPLFTVIPDQGILAGTSFEYFNLDDYEIQYGGNCQQFDYEPIMVINDPPTPNPNWAITGNFQNTMTVTAQVQYSPKYKFVHPNDRLIAMVNGQLRGIASPVLNGGKYRYYMSIGGGTVEEVMEIKFYSGYQKKIYNFQQTIIFKAYSNIGNFSTPYIVELAPIVPILDFTNGIQMSIIDSSWVGEQTYKFKARDCFYPDVLKAEKSAKFCIVSDTSDLYTYYRDFDGDGFGTPNNSIFTCSEPASGYVNNSLDCDDNNPSSIELPVYITNTEVSGYQPNDAFICSGAPVVLSAYGGSVFDWNNGYSGFENLIYPIETSNYSVTVTNENGCIGSKIIQIEVEGKVVKNMANAGNKTLRSVIDCLVSGDTITYDQPTYMTTLLTSPLTINKNVTIEGLNINSKPEISINFNLTTSGIMIDNGKTLTLRNCDFRLINPVNKPTFVGPGNIKIHESSIIKSE
jgi:hypothetical protein